MTDEICAATGTFRPLGSLKARKVLVRFDEEKFGWFDMFDKVLSQMRIEGNSRNSTKWGRYLFIRSIKTSLSQPFTVIQAILL